MISRKEALNRSLKNTSRLKGEIWSEIVEASERGDTEVTVDIGVYSPESVSKNLKLLKLEGYEDLHITNHFQTLVIRW